MCKIIRDCGQIFTKFIHQSRNHLCISLPVHHKADIVESICRQTKEGETIPLCQYPLDLQTETYVADNFVFLLWPATVVHRITSSSPLWDISRNQLRTERFEVIVFLEGIVR